MSDLDECEGNEEAGTFDDRDAAFSAGYDQAVDEILRWIRNDHRDEITDPTTRSRLARLISEIWTEGKRCPDCGGPAERDMVDVGPGEIPAGPWYCDACQWIDTPVEDPNPTGDDEGRCTDACRAMPPPQATPWALGRDGGRQRLLLAGLSRLLRGAAPWPSVARRARRSLMARARNCPTCHRSMSRCRGYDLCLFDAVEYWRARAIEAQGEALHYLTALLEARDRLTPCTCPRDPSTIRCGGDCASVIVARAIRDGEPRAQSLIEGALSEEPA